MKFKILNNEPLQFYDSNADLTGTIKISGSNKDLHIQTNYNNNQNIIIGNSDTLGDVEFGITAAPVNLRLLGGGTLTSNGNILYIGDVTAGDRVVISNATFTSSLQITGSLRVSGSAYAHYFVGDGSGLTNINASASIAVRDEGNLLTSTISSIDFVGAGVSASAAGGNVTVTINGGGGSVDTGSLVTTASFNSFTSSYTTGSFTGSFSGNGSGLIGVISSSYAVSASYALNATTSSYTQTASIALSSLNASDILIYVKNVTGASIAKGKVVRISGATGDNALISTASWDSDGVSANTLGIANETIADQAFGYVMTEGKLLGINTDSFTAGQLLFLGPTGSIISAEPIPPKHSVRLGQALRIQQNNGSMYVRIDNGYELDELHNVLIISGSDGDLLVASGSNGNGKKLYINSRQLTGSYGLTGSLSFNTGGITGSLFGTASWARNATTSSFINVTNTSNASDYYIIGIDSDNGAQNPEQLYNFGTLAFNPDDNTLKVANGSGTMIGTASYATKAQNGFPYTGSAQITGSLGVTGSFIVNEYESNILQHYDIINTTNKTIQKVFSPGLDDLLASVIDWGNETLSSYNSTWNTVQPTIDWSNRILYTPGSPFAINKESVDWGNRYLRYSNTTVATPPISVNWGAGTLNDTNDATALKWNTPGTLTVSASMVLSASVTASSGNSATSDALLQATLLYLSNNF